MQVPEGDPAQQLGQGPSHREKRGDWEVAKPQGPERLDEGKPQNPTPTHGREAASAIQVSLLWTGQDHTGQDRTGQRDSCQKPCTWARVGGAWGLGALIAEPERRCLSHAEARRSAPAGTTPPP